MSKGITQLRSLYEESLSVKWGLDDRRGISASLTNIGTMALVQGDYAGARAAHEESLVIERALGDKWGIANSANNLGSTIYNQGDYEGAQVLYRDTLALQREIGDKRGVAGSLSNLGNLAIVLGHYTDARALYEESLAIRAAIGDKKGIASCLAGLAGVVTGKAVHLAGGSSEIEHRPLQHIALPEITGTQGGRGTEEYEPTHSELLRAVRLLGAVAGILESIRARLEPEEADQYERTIETTRSTVGAEAFGRAWEEGHRPSMEEAVEHAVMAT